MRAVKGEVEELDGVLMAFARRVGEEEGRVEGMLGGGEGEGEEVGEGGGGGGGRGGKRVRAVSVEEVVRYAGVVAGMSFSPSDVTERKGQSLSRPPAPLEGEMGVSLLQMSVEEMVGWVEARRREEEGVGEGGLGAEGGRVGLGGGVVMPSVAEVQKAVVAAEGEGLVVRRAVSAVTSSGAAAASMLDLDLNPDVDDSDDDDDDSDDEG